VDELLAEPQGPDRGHGLLRSPHRSLQAALRLVRDRSRKPANPSLPCHRESHGALGHPAAAPCIPRRTSHRS
jgi:hypothetical protein